MQPTGHISFKCNAQTKAWHMQNGARRVEKIAAYKDCHEDVKPFQLCLLSLSKGC